MSNSVDQRIVQMMFDNAQFEKGVSSTLQSLKALDEGLTLKKGSAGIDQVQKSVNNLKFDNAISQTSGFEKALGSLKTTAGGVFSSIMDAVGNMSSGIKLVTGLLGSGLAGMMISGGWKRASNINMAEFKLRGMYEAMGYKGKEAGEMVEKAMDDAAKAVDGTAYALDSAVMAASNLAASGVEAGPALEGTLRSIAGLAAMSGRDFDSVAQIVSTVAGQGKLMTMQLRQFEMSGLNVAAILADAFDTTEETIREMVTDGKVSFEVFSQVMEEKFAGAAAKANETFDGSLANIRAALSRTFATFFVYGQKGMVPVFNGIRMAINGVNTALSPLLGEDGVLTKGAYKVLTKVGKALKSWSGYVDKYVKDADGNIQSVREWFRQEEIDKMTRFFQGIADALQTPMNVLAQVLPRVVRIFMYVGGIIREVVRLFGELVSPIFTAFKNVFSDNFFGMVSSWIANLVKHVYDLVSAFHIGRAYGAVLEAVFTALFSIIKAVAGVVGGVFTVAFRIASDVIFALAKAVEVVLDVIGGFIDMFGWAAQAVEHFLKRAVKTNHTGFAKIATGFKNLTKGAKLFLDVVAGKDKAFSKFTKFISSLDKGAGEKVKAMGAAFETFSAVVSHSGELIQGTFRFIADTVYDFIKPFLGPLREAIWDIGDGVVSFIDTIAGGISELVPEKIRETADSISQFFGNLVGFTQLDGAAGTVAGFFEGLKEQVTSSDLYQKASEHVSEFTESFKAFAESFKESSAGVAADVLDRLKGAIGGFFEFLEPARQALQNFLDFFKLGEFDGTLESFGSILDNIKEKLDISGAIQGAVDFLIAAGKAIAFFFGAIASAPVLVATSAMTAVRALLERMSPFLFLASEAFQKFGGAVSEAFGKLQESFAEGGFSLELVQNFAESVAEAFSSLLGDLGNILPRIGTTIFNYFRDTFVSLGDTLKNLSVDAIQPIFDAIGGFISDLGIIDKLKGFGLSGPLEALSSFFTSVVPSKVVEVVHAIGSFISMASSAAFSVAGVAFEAVSSGASHFFKFLSKIGESLAGFKDTAVNAFKGLGGLSTPFENFFEKIRTAVEWFSWSMNNGSSFKDAFRSFASSIRQGFNGLIEEASPVISDFARKLGDGLKTSFEAIIGDFGSFVGSALSTVPKLIGEALGALDSLGAFDGLKDAGFTKPLNALQDFFSNVAPAKIKDVAKNISNFLAPSLGGLMSFGGKVRQIFADSDFFGPMKTFGASVGDALKTFFDAIDGKDISVEAVKDLAHSIADSFGQFLSESFAKVLDVGGQLFGALTSVIGGPFEKIASFGGNVFGKISGFIKGLFEVIASFDPTGFLQNFDLSAPLESVKNFVSEALDIDVSKLSGLNGVIETIKGVIKKLLGLEDEVDKGFDFSMLKNESGSIYRRLFEKYFGDTGDLDGSVSSVGERVKSIIDGFKKFINDPLGTVFDILANAVNTFAEKYSEFKTKLDTDKLKTFVDDVAKLAKHAAGLVVLWEVVQMFENVGHFASSMARMADAFRTLAFEMKQLSQDARRFIRTQAILNIAIAIGILIAAIAGLVYILKNNDSGDIMAAITIVEVLLLELVGIMVIISYLKFEPEKIAGFISVVQSLALAVAAMALIIALLGGLDEGQLYRGLGALTGIMVMMTILMAVTTMVPEHFGSLKGTFLGIAAALLVITVVVQILGSMDPGVLSRGGALLIGLMVLLGVLSATVQHFSKGAAVGATALIEIAASILILTAAIGVLAMIPSSRLDEAVFEVVGLIAVMTTALIALTRFTKSSDLKGTGKALAGFAASIILISVAVGMLAFVSEFGGNLAGGLASVIVLIAAMSVAILAISTMGKDAENAAKAIKAFGVAIGIIAVAVVALSLLPSAQVIPALLGLCAVIVLFAGSLTVLTLAAGKFPQGAGLLIGMFVAIGAMALMVAGAISWLAKSLNDSPQIVSALSTLCTGLIVFAVAMAALIAIADLFKAGAILVVAVLLAFGATSLMVATAMETLADALLKLSIIGPRFALSIVDSLKLLGNGLWEARESMAQGIAGIGSAMIAGFLMIIPEGLRVFGAFLLELVGVAIEFAPAMGEAAIVLIGGLVSGIATGIENHGGDVLDAVLHLFDVVIAGIKDVFTGALTEFGNWLADITGFAASAEAEASQSAGDMSKAASESAKENNTVAEDTKEELAEAKKAWETETPGIAALAEKYGLSGIGGIKDSAKGFNIMEVLGLDSASMDINLAELSEKAKSMGITLPENITTMVENGLGETSLSSIMDEQGFIDTEAATTLASDAGVSVAQDGWGPGLEEGISSTAKLDDLLAGTGVVDLDAITTQFTEAGSTASTSFVGGFEDGLVIDGSGPVKKAAEKMKMEKEFKSSGSIDGKAAVAGFESGLKKFADKAKNASSAAQKKIKDDEKNMKSAGRSSGSALVEGLISGINSQIPALTSAVEKLERLAERAYNAKAKIKSPSRVWAKMGAYMVQGLIVGMESMHGSLKTASEDTADLAISTAATQMSYLSGLLEDIDDQPVIRPVLDLTDYNAGLAQMQGFDTYNQLVSAQSALRGLSVMPRGYQESETDGSKSGPNISIYLNYDASADANQIVMDIANGLEARLAMEGV